MNKTMRLYRKDDRVFVDNNYRAVVLADQKSPNTNVAVTLLYDNGRPDACQYSIEPDRLCLITEITLGQIQETFPFLNLSEFARILDMNPSLLRHYAKGDFNASEERRHEIEDALHSLGRSLLNCVIL